VGARVSTGGSWTQSGAEILERLAWHAVLGNQAGEVAALAARDRTAVARCLASFMPTIHGYQRELLAGLAVMLDLAASPTRRQVADGARRGERLVLARLSAGTVAPELFAALTDPFEAFRLEAALALIRSGERRGSKRRSRLRRSRPKCTRAPGRRDTLASAGAGCERLNAGVSAAHYPLVAVVLPHSMPSGEGLITLVHPFLDRRRIARSLRARRRRRLSGSNFANDCGDCSSFVGPQASLGCRRFGRDRRLSAVDGRSGDYGAVHHICPPMHSSCLILKYWFSRSVSPMLAARRFRCLLPVWLAGRGRMPVETRYGLSINQFAVSAPPRTPDALLRRFVERSRVAVALPRWHRPQLLNPPLWRSRDASTPPNTAGRGPGAGDRGSGLCAGDRGTGPSNDLHRVGGALCTCGGLMRADSFELLALDLDSVSA
jgi:hypothetical protein